MSVDFGLLIWKRKKSRFGSSKINNRSSSIFNRTAKARVRSLPILRYGHALNALVEINPLLERVVFAVQGSADYGSDSAFYQQMGYVRKSDRKKGLTRKRIAPADGTPAVPVGDSPSTDAE